MTAAPGGESGGLVRADGPHVLVTDVGRPELGAEDQHHLERVLRIRHGSPLTVGDGAGRWRACIFELELEPVGDVMSVPRPDPVLTIGFALVKQGRPELIVQKLTEIGIDRMVPFAAGRSVVRWDQAKAAKNHERLRRVAREAVMQSHRAWVPEILPVMSFEEVALEGVVLAEPGGRAVSELDHTVLIGPEGGWTDAESAAVSERVAVAENVLRTETAAIAAATLMTSRRAGL